jgi:hypothetical protein
VGEQLPHAGGRAEYNAGSDHFAELAVDEVSGENSNLLSLI